MMPNLDDTQPHKIVTDKHMPPVRPDLIEMEGPEESSGPGCLVWGMVTLFMLGLGLVVVFMAGLAGWNEGLGIARGNATATRSADIATQCERIAVDLGNRNTGLAQRRFDDLLLLTPAPDCIAIYAPGATALAIELQPTATPTPSPTLEITAEVTPIPQESVEPTLAITSSESSSGYDLAGLLTEAQQLLGSSGRTMEAIDLLDAIAAIDPNYEKATVDRLLYNALTSEALRIYRTGGNLAEAILLTNRAEQYGDVGELSFERYVAQLYLEALTYRNTNFPLAIRVLNSLVQVAPNYRDAQQMLIGQYVAYGDAFVAQGVPCSAVSQYNSALQFSSSGEIIGKRSAAESACSLSLTPTVPADFTPDPNAPPIAPIGQPGS